MNYLTDFAQAGYRVSPNSEGGHNMVSKRGHEYTTVGNKRGFVANTRSPEEWKKRNALFQAELRKGISNHSDIDDNGLQLVDVAFSFKTKYELDDNGDPILDANGNPVVKKLGRLDELIAGMNSAKSQEQAQKSYDEFIRATQLSHRKKMKKAETHVAKNMPNMAKSSTARPYAYIAEDGSFKVGYTGGPDFNTELAKYKDDINAKYNDQLKQAHINMKGLPYSTKIYRDRTVFGKFEGNESNPNGPGITPPKNNNNQNKGKGKGKKGKS